MTKKLLLFVCTVSLIFYKVKSFTLDLRLLCLKLFSSFLSHKIKKLKNEIVQFSTINKNAPIWSLNEMTGFKTILDGRIKYLFIVLFLVSVNSVSGQCVGNLITNGDFSNGGAGWTWATIQGKEVETNEENTYFSTGNTGGTAELDKDATLRQVVTVVPNTSYTISFIYARRQDAGPTTVSVDFRVTGGATPNTFTRLTTSNSTPQVGSFTFTPTSNSIGVEFWNSLNGNSTLGTIIDNIVLIPTSQVAPFATTVPKGTFRTLTACSNTPIQLDVENISASGVTYSWSGTGGAVFSSTTIKNPTVTFTSTGIQQATVTATNSSGCSGSPSTTFINVNASPIASITGSNNICAGFTTTLSPTSGGTWTSSNTAVATVTNAGVVTGLSAGTATFTFTNTASPNCSATTLPVTISSALSTAFNTSGTFNFTVPAGVTNLQVECWGGGGAGGTATGNNSTGGGGSGGAHVKNISISVTPNSSYTVTVGVGGTASPTASVSAGGQSWFGSASTILAVGGNGAASITNGTNGAGAVAVTTGNVGGINVYGAGGGNAIATGGRTAGSGGAGGNGGAGGTGINSTGDGAPGTNPGGAGAGGRASNNTPRLGGSGGGGRVIITVTPPTASSGGSQTICQNGTATVSGASATNGTILWTHNGTGSLSNATTLTPTYTAAAGDAGKTVILTMTVSYGSCTTPATATYSVIVKNTPTASAGGSQTICQNGTATISGASSSNGTIAWTHNGAGSLTNASTLTPAYTAAAGDAGKTITLTMTVSNGPCADATATYSVIVKNTPTASAGGSQTICQNGTATVSGASSSNGIIAWTHNGAGSLSGASTLTPAYTAAAGDAGKTITLTMTVSNSPCADATATYSVVVKSTPTASAGGTQTICQNGTATVSGASSSNGIIAWTHNGAGSLSGASTLTPAYTAAAGDAGKTITLTMTVSNGPCSDATATYSVIVKSTPTASAGGSQTICQNGTATVSGASSSNGTIAWTHNGAGSLTNASTLTPAYTAAAGDAGKTITLTMTVSNGPCADATATYSVIVKSTPTASAGGSQTICQNGTATVSGASSSNGTIAWTHNGAGSLTNASTLTPAYTAAAGDAGKTITLTMTVSNGPCADATATYSVIVKSTPTASAGGSQTICQNGTATVSGASSSNGTIAWTHNGAGSLSGASTLTPAYTAATGDAGKTITLTMTVSNSPCADATATYSVIVSSLPTATAGGTQTICSNATATVSGATSSNGTILWTENGAGSITSGATTLTPVYTPIAADAGTTVTLTMTVSNSPCVNATAIYSVIVNPLPTANAGGALASICQGATSASMGGSVGGGATGGTWSGGSGSWANANNPSTATYKAGATESGSVTLTLTTSGGSCGTTTATKSITITQLPTITTQPQALSLCVGQSGSFKLVPAAPAQSYQWEYSSDGVSGWQITDTAAGVSGHSTTTLSLINVPLSYNGYYVRCVLTNGTCPVYTTPVQLTVNPLPTAPTASVTTQPTCAAPTATITVSSPAAGSGFEYSLDGTSYVSSAVFTGVSSGLHNITVKNTSTGCESAQTQINVAPSATKKWNGSVSTDWNTPANWTPNGVPTLTDCVEIPKTGNNPSIAKGSGNFNMHTLTVDYDSVLTVGSGSGTPNTITVTNEVTVSGPGPLPGSVAGVLIFENATSLFQTNTASNINSGNITYKRDTQPVRRYDLTYWGTPVTATSGFTLKNLSPATLGDKYYSYNNTTDKWVPEYNGLAVMMPGKGYNVRAPQTYAITGAGVIYTASFIGVPNNGDVPIPVVGANWSLSGNPYPSAVDATKFIGDNGTNVGTLYFWTHATNPSTAYPGVDKYNYNTDDYALFNLTGPAEAAPSTPGGTPSSGFIAAGQGFFFKPSVTGTVLFTNSMRKEDNNTQFFKTAQSNAVEKNRVWLNLTNESGAFKQMLVGYISGASNIYDINYDAETTGSNAFIDFYTINDSRKLTIQGRTVPFDDTEVLPIGYKSSIAGDFTIGIDHTDGLFTQQAIYLEDKTTGKIQNLTAGNYTFTTAIGTFAERFVLRYTNKTLGTGDIENLENTVLVSVKDKAIKVTSSQETIRDVVIYDVSGKLLYEKTKVGTTEYQISNLQSSNQVLLVKVTLENDFTTTKKIIFK